jgi:hypothetical protein
VSRNLFSTAFMRDEKEEDDEDDEVGWQGLQWVEVLVMGGAGRCWLQNGGARIKPISAQQSTQPPMVSSGQPQAVDDFYSTSPTLIRGTKGSDCLHRLSANPGAMCSSHQIFSHRVPTCRNWQCPRARNPSIAGSKLGPNTNHCSPSVN